MIVYIPLAVAFIASVFPPRRKIGERIWKVACPECGTYLSLAEWKCPGGEIYLDRHIIEGCPIDGVRYGSGEDSAPDSAECNLCGFQFNFYTYPYPFERWSILEKGEDSDQELLLIIRHSWMYTLGTTFALAGGIVALYLIVKDLSRLTSQSLSIETMVPVAGFIGIGWALLLLESKIYPPKRFIRNPKFRGES